MTYNRLEKLDIEGRRKLERKFGAFDDSDYENTDFD